MKHIIGQPVPGFYQIRMVKGGVMVGVVIYHPCKIEMHPEFWNVLDRTSPLSAMVNGKEADPYDVWTRCCDKPITQREYEFLLADRTWAARYAPELPEATPTRRVNVRDLPINSLMP